MLLFDTNIYFAKDTYSLRELIDSPAYHDHEEWIGFRTPNLVDSFYSIALRRGDGWAFAINEQAMLRMVRRKSSDGLPQESVGKYAEWLPTTLAETAEQIAAEWVFEEADLTKCEGAIAYLRRFPAQQEHKLWDESSLIWSPEYLEKDKTDYIIVTADGDGVLVRAKGIADQRPVEKLVQPGYMIYDQWNGGAAYDWALQMERIVRPCLTVATVSPPWQMYLTASLGHQD